MFQRAIELDPLYSSAYVDLGWCYFDSIRYGWTASPSEALQNAHDLAQQALGIEESDAGAHRLLGSVYLKWTQYDLAESEFERALKTNPNDAASHDDHALRQALAAGGQRVGQPSQRLQGMPHHVGAFPLASLLAINLHCAASCRKINLAPSGYLGAQHHARVPGDNETRLLRR